MRSGRDGERGAGAVPLIPDPLPGPRHGEAMVLASVAALEVLPPAVFQAGEPLDDVGGEAGGACQAAHRHPTARAIASRPEAASGVTSAGTGHGARIGGVPHDAVDGVPGTQGRKYVRIVRRFRAEVVASTCTGSAM